jgi:hypothetical protein
MIGRCDVADAKHEDTTATAHDAPADEKLARKRRPWKTPRLFVESSESTGSKSQYHSEFTIYSWSNPFGPS